MNITPTQNPNSDEFGLKRATSIAARVHASAKQSLFQRVFWLLKNDVCL